MNCENVTEHVPDYLTGNLDAAAHSEMQAHLDRCAHCQAEVASLSQTWARLGQLPAGQPSEALRARFYTMLEAYERGLQRERLAPALKEAVNGWLERWWPRQPAFQFALALAFLVTGLFVGQRLQAPDYNEMEIAHLRTEMQGMRQMLALSLLQQPSPSERLRGVSWSHQMEQPDREVLAALLQTLNYDPNVNVRLAATEALLAFGDQPSVRQGVIEALPRQNSPLVQIRLINLLVELREKRADATLRQLVGDEQINQEVRQRAEWGLQQLF